jgi:8-oxo-dGTP pyrophosphatase MutT (NUDIX family)
LKTVLTDCTGVAVISGQKVLLGLRADGQGWGLAGGKREANETMEECAQRELFEEFGLRARHLTRLGTVEAPVRIKGKPALVGPSIYSCESFIGEVRIEPREIIEFGWFTIDEALLLSPIFPPSREGLKLLLEKLPHLNKQ